MKKKINMKIIWALFLIVIWTVPVFDMYVSAQIFIFWSAFIFGLAFYRVIKNKVLSTCVVLLITVAVSIYKVNYLITVFPVELLIISYIEARREDEKKKKSNIFETLVSLLFIGELIYSIVKLAENDIRMISHLKEAFICLSWMVIGFFVLFLLASKKEQTKGKKNKKKISNRLRFIYIMAVFGMLISVFSYYARYSQVNVFSPNAEFFCWYIFSLIVIFSDDPVARGLTETA